MEVLKSFFKDKFNIFGIITAFLASVYNLPKYFEGYVEPVGAVRESWITLDPSWLITLSYANIKNLAWGTDFIFTYGPLSYFATRVGWGVDKIDFILYDFFITLNFFLVYFISFRLSKNKTVTTLLILTVAFLTPILMGAAMSLILMAFLVFWIRRSIEKPAIVYYFFQIILLCLLFFIKLNTGLIAFPLFAIGIFYNILDKKGNVFMLLVILVVPFMIIIGLCPFLNVDLWNYIISSTEIISGYNDIMFLEHTIKNRTIALLVIFILCSIFFYKSIKEKKINYLKNGAVFLIFAIPTFTLYKSGFVRGMESDFFINYIFIVLVIQDFHFQNFKKISNFCILTCLGLSFYFLYVLNNTPVIFSEKINKQYFAGLSSFTPTSGMHISPTPNKFPERILKIIGSKTVDAYPWNSIALLENQLNFTPRPIFQAYTAYTPYLETLNFNFYNSLKAPEFIVYDFTSIDYRYPLFDESKVNMCILKNYTPVEFFESMQRKVILLQKNKNFKPLRFEKIREYAMLLESPLVLKKDLFYELGVYNSFYGKIISIINHAPEVKLVANFDGGNNRTYHIGSKLLASGIFLDKHVVSTEDFLKLYNPDSLKTIQQINFFNLKAVNQSMFKDKIRITEYKITQ